MNSWRWLIAALVVVVLLAGGVAWALLVGQQAQNRIAVNYPEGVAAAVPLGITAGAAPTIAVSTANPLSADPNAAQNGKQYYRSLNCAGCHGYSGKGGMGPDLTDHAWRYGGTPIDIYKSIYEGRPKGMPAWGNSLPPNTVWLLVSYVQSLGGALSPPPAGVQEANVEPGQGMSETTSEASKPASEPAAPSSQTDSKAGGRAQPPASAQ